MSERFISGDVGRMIFFETAPHRVFELYRHKYNYLLNPKLWLRKLQIDTGRPLEEVTQIWDLPSEIYPELSFYQNYVRVLSFYNIVVPGSQHFILPQKCYDYATQEQNLELMTFFGQTLGKDIEKDYVEARKRNYATWDISNEVLQEILKTFHRIMVDKIVDLRDLMSLAAIRNQWDYLIDQSQIYKNIPSEELEQFNILAKVVHDDLQGLQADYPDKLNLDTEEVATIIETALYQIPQIKEEIYRWLSKNTDRVFELLRYDFPVFQKIILPRMHVSGFNGVFYLSGYKTMTTNNMVMWLASNSMRVFGFENYLRKYLRELNPNLEVAIKTLVQTTNPECIDLTIIKLLKDEYWEPVPNFPNPKELAAMIKDNFYLIESRTEIDL